MKMRAGSGFEATEETTNATVLHGSLQSQLHRSLLVRILASTGPTRRGTGGEKSGCRQLSRAQFNQICVHVSKDP